MNIVILKGNLAADPETRAAGSTTVTTVRIATSEKWKDRDGQPKERADFHSCQIWGKRGEAFARFHSKGSEALVRGRIQYRQHEDKWYTDITVDDWTFIGGKKSESRGSRPAPPPPSAPSGGGGFSDDEIPF